ncbi:MAG: GNAT family N-acetyltransferase [Acidobacteria bacterium]|nr:GNAT family N-acetyltransferase [Acidobacteriota bacterium]
MGLHLEDLEISAEPALNLTEYATVSIAFEIQHLLRTKDYDSIPGNAPTDWPNRFNMASWGLFSARLNGKLVGGAIVAHNTLDVDMLEGRTDLAILWDLRVAPEYRGQGIGSALWKVAETWSIRKACRQLKVETQNINVGACTFYARQGCYLGESNPHAYPDFPEETQLLWYKDLPPAIDNLSL